MRVGAVLGDTGYGVGAAERGGEVWGWGHGSGVSVPVLGGWDGSLGTGAVMSSVVTGGRGT